jgi:hypothetical protein
VGCCKQIGVRGWLLGRGVCVRGMLGAGFVWVCTNSCFGLLKSCIMAAHLLLSVRAAVGLEWGVDFRAVLVSVNWAGIDFQC